ncbi:mechanosensitive ion channel family protein [Francisella philomiragia]
MDLLKTYYMELINNSTSIAILIFIVLLLAVLLFSWIINKIISKYISSLAERIFFKANSSLGKSLIKNKIFDKLAHIAPAVFIYIVIGFLSSTTYPWIEQLVSFIQLIAEVYITISIISFFISLIDAIFSYFQSLHEFKYYSLKSYAQVVKILLYLVGVILVISLLLNKSPIAFLTGLGALSAVLMLVFKDTILGFATNIQVAALDMVRVGDWISIQSLGVEGTVQEISINTVKIRGFDKTIYNIPTYSLITNSVKNWRGMFEMGGRQIKRSFNIDVDSIKFCDVETLDNLRKLNYMDEIINSCNKDELINTTLFRKYLERYLKDHPKIHTEPGWLFIVRELQPTEKGLPIQLYMYTTDTVWANYEAIQAGIFDYIYASMHLFGLRAFQDIRGRIDNLKTNT